MFKSVRWRSEKHKISAVFRLSFHATQAVQSGGGSALVLSVVPADTGKPTAKLEKCEIRDDCCYWENSIFETVKFVQDTKNGKIGDRIYNFVISTGSAKSSIVGEASVNLSEYVEATKAASISLPFKSSNSDAVLHVSIQRIHENVNQRELEDPKNKPEDRTLKGQFGKCDAEEIINTDYNEEKPLTKPQVLPSMMDPNANGRASIGSDITLSGSDNSSVLDAPQELGPKSNEAEPHNQHRATGWEWSLSGAHDSSTDDSTNSQRDDALDEFVEKLKSDLILLSRKADIADLELQALRKQIVKENKRGQDLLKELASLKEEKDGFKEECERLKASHRARSNMNYEGNPWDLLEETRQELSHEKDRNADLRLQLHKTQESNSELILAVQDLEQLLEQANRGELNLSTKPVSCHVSEKLEGSADDDDEQKALEELVKQHSDAKEAYALEQKIMDLCSEIEMYRRDKDELEMQMEQLALDYEILKQENHDMSYKLEQSYLQLQLKLQYECSGSYATIHELENQVEKLEREIDNRSDDYSDALAIIKDLENQNDSLRGELDKQAGDFKTETEALSCAKSDKEQQAVQAEEALRLARLELGNQIEKLQNELEKQSREFSDALSTIKDHEAHIRSLEEELDKQAHGFESDLEAITRAKVDQEQRAIRAEEALRLSKRKNANMAERLQDEFRRLSGQMKSTFEANEKVATTAMTEASHLRLANNHLEEMLQEAREELQSVREDYEARMTDLRKQLSLKLVEIEEKDEKDLAVRNLENEVDTLRAECEEMRRSLIEDELEKEKLGKQVLQLKGELKKKDDTLTNMERKLKDNNGRAIAAERRTKASSKNSKTELVACSPKEAASFKERIKLLEDQIKQKEVAIETSANAFLEKEKDLHNKIEELETKLEEVSQTRMVDHEDGNREVDAHKHNENEHGIDALLKEMTSLREEKSTMEAELEEMQERYSEISLKFAEVEGERQRLVMTLRNVKNTKMTQRQSSLPIN